MKLSILFLSLLVISMIISCSVKPFVTTSDYDGGIIEGETLLIMPVSNSSLTSLDEIKETFGDMNPEDVYLSFFQEKFANILSKVSSFSEVFLNPAKQTDKLRATEFIIPGNDTTYFYLPQGNEKINDVEGNVADFILFISKLEVAPSWIDIEYGQKPNVRHTVYYLFWDNHMGRVVSYGKASHIDGATEKDKETFRLFINNLAKSLIENTPFKKQRDQW